MLSANVIPWDRFEKIGNHSKILPYNFCPTFLFTFHYFLLYFLAKKIAKIAHQHAIIRYIILLMLLVNVDRKWNVTLAHYVAYNFTRHLQVSETSPLLFNMWIGPLKYMSPTDLELFKQINPYRRFIKCANVTWYCGRKA